MSATVRGYLLEFSGGEDLLAAVETLVDLGYRRLEAFTPFPVPGLDERLPATANPVPLLIFLGGLVGGLIGYGIQYYSAVIDYPILAGGKPMHSWPAFVPVTFELAVLGGALSGFLSAIWCNGLPRLHHPLFDVPAFDLASRDRFFLLVDAGDARFQAQRTRDEIGDLPTFALHSVNLEEDE